MVLNLEKGQKIKVSSLTSATILSIEVTAQDNDGIIYDMSCFGLDSQGKCSDDRYFVFYNQRETPEKCIVLERPLKENQEVFRVDLLKVPNNIKKVVFTLTIDGDDHMSKLSNGTLKILCDNAELARFSFVGNDFNQEKAIMVGELYELNQEWRFGAIGQGFNGGLSALLKYFGIEEIVEEESELLEPAQESPLNTQQPSIKNRFSTFAKELFNAPIEFFEKQKSQFEAKQEAKRQAQAESNKFYADKEQFKQHLKTALSDGVLTQQEMQQLDEFCQSNELNMNALLVEFQPIIHNFLNRLLVDICADNNITDEEEKSINAACEFLKPSQQIKDEIKQRITRVKTLQKIKSGQITHIASGSLITKTDEMIWHKNNNANLVRDLQTRRDLHRGEIFITSQRVIFQSREHPVEIPLSNILSVESNITTVFINGKNKKSTCQFKVAEPDMVEAYLEQAIAKFHRKLNIRQTSGSTRSISQDVKQKVWLRDGGQCVQCSATDYLEFDHIIPFSKGGSSSENNVQLLCRRCNLAKSDRL